MSVQRFNPFPGVSRTEKTTEGKPLPIAFMAQLPDGEWVKFSDHQSYLAERAQRIADAEMIMLLHRDGKHEEAQIAYMDYCGKWLGEPSRG